MSEDTDTLTKLTGEDVKLAVWHLKETSEVEYGKLISFMRTFEPSLQGRPASIHSNPAVVGLGGFGAAVILMQLSDLGYVGRGPMCSLAIMLGGFLQLVAGLHEFQTGNNFGYASFSTYGAFWVALGLMPLGEQLKLYTISKGDMGALFVVFTVFTFIFLLATTNMDMSLFLLFLLLFFGFVLADVAQLSDLETGKIATRASASLFITAGLISWYIMAHQIYMDVFKKNVLPVGGPLFAAMQTHSYAVNRPPNDQREAPFKNRA